MKEDPSKDIKSIPISSLDGKYDNHDNHMSYKSIQLLSSLLHSRFCIVTDFNGRRQLGTLKFKLV